MIHVCVYIKVATACARESSDLSLHQNCLITIITIVPLCIFIVRSSFFYFVALERVCFMIMAFARYM